MTWPLYLTYGIATLLVFIVLAYWLLMNGDMDLSVMPAPAGPAERAGAMFALFLVVLLWPIFLLLIALAVVLRIDRE